MLRKMYLMPSSRPLRISSATGGVERRRQTGRDGPKTQPPTPVARVLRRQRHTSGTKRRPHRGCENNDNILMHGGSRHVSDSSLQSWLRDDRSLERGEYLYERWVELRKERELETLNRPPLKHSRSRRFFWSL
jgi:hypothetical protein